jgi:hypothetical protein
MLVNFDSVHNLQLVMIFLNFQNLYLELAQLFETILNIHITIACNITVDMVMFTVLWNSYCLAVSSHLYIIKLAPVNRYSYFTARHVFLHLAFNQLVSQSNCGFTSSSPRYCSALLLSSEWHFLPCNHSLCWVILEVSHGFSVITWPLAISVIILEGQKERSWTFLQTRGACTLACDPSLLLVYATQLPPNYHVDMEPVRPAAPPPSSPCNDAVSWRLHPWSGEYLASAFPW